MSNIQAGNLAYQQFIDTTTQLGMTEMQRFALIDNLVTSQAYMLSTNQLMLLAGLILVALMPLIWLSKPPFGSGLIGH